jgi:DNA mismatch endonuclease, patch repair protein
VDSISSSRRSEIMSRVRARDTAPEMSVRRLVHGMGYRYRLHSTALPGKPDLVFGKRKKVIFVHGCFWHRHSNCALARMPKSRLDFWLPKLEGNRKRDKRNLHGLRKLGWESLVVWECEISPPKEARLKNKIGRFLDA